MGTNYGRGTGERGTVLIQVAIGILGLTAFTAFVVDYGVLWVSRNQAQNAADAGALAGAIAWAYDDLSATTPASGGKVELSARRAARCASGSASCPATPDSANPVWATQAGASSGVEVLWTCPPTYAGRCVTVNVYRDGTNASSTLPTFFGGLLGITSQGIRATASARVAYANAANCMRPFSVADKWNELLNPALAYNHYDGVGDILAGVVDQYIPPTSTSAGSGFRLPDDWGVQKVLKLGNENNGETIQSGWSLPVRLPDGLGGYLSGGDDYREAIAGCKAGTVTIGDYLPLENGQMAGPTNQGVDDLRAKDSGASWNSGTKTISGSCAPNTCGPISPRIVPISVWDMDEFLWRDLKNDWSSTYTDYNGYTHQPPGGTCPGSGAKCVRVVNILGFFVDNYNNGQKTVTGYLATYPGTFVSGVSTLGGGASFLTSIQLVR